MNIIYDQVKNYIATRRVGHLTTTGNALNEMNLTTDDMVYDADVSTALSRIYRNAIQCGDHRLISLGKSRVHSRNHNRPANLYQVVSA